MSDTFARLAHLISWRFGCEESTITPTSDFKLDLDFDSLDEIELLMAAEDEFGICIPDDALTAGVSNVTDAVALIQKQIEVPA